jgi:hypothetical protein
MPLASLFALQWYGPQCLSVVDVAESTGSAELHVSVRVGAADLSQSTGTARLYKGLAVRAVGMGGSSGTAQPRIKCRVGAVGKVNETSVSEIATALWGALATINNKPGTMGEKLNAAGAAGNPWVDPTGVQVAEQLDELHRINGLKPGEPMTVTPTSRVAGDITQAFSGDGTTTTTVMRA